MKKNKTEVTRMKSGCKYRDYFQVLVVKDPTAPESSASLGFSSALLHGLRMLQTREARAHGQRIEVITDERRWT